VKIIEAMKQIKGLVIKAEDLKKKVATHCTDVDYETPLYADQKAQVAQWIQAHSDVLKEILRLRVAIQRTNLATNVSIVLGDKTVTKSIAEWIHRRRDLAGMEGLVWQQLTDRNLKEGVVRTTQGVDQLVKIRRYWDAKERDAKVELFRTEPMIIDSTLEVVNAVTDLVE